MSPWESGQLHINNTTIHYTRTGGDKPPLLLAHGYTDNGLYWSRVAQALEADYDVVMPDARGHGHSPGPDEPYTSDLHADDLASDGAAQAGHGALRGATADRMQPPRRTRWH